MSLETQHEPPPLSSASPPTASTPLQGFTGPDQPRDDIMQRCIRCGLCLPTCPTYVETLSETSSPRGRIRLIQSVSENKLDLTSPGFVEQMYQCLDCRACEAVCPSGVEYGQLVETARAQIERARVRPARQRVGRAAIFAGLFGDARRFRLASHLLRLYQHSGAQNLVHATGILDKLHLNNIEAMLPQFPDQFVVPANQVYPPLANVKHHGRIAFFAGCVMSTAFAETDRATIRVLAANGFEVITPYGQQCCGALTIHAGEMDHARALARRNIIAFENTGADYLVVNAAGCGSQLKEYGQLFADDPDWSERAATFSSRVRDLTELLGRLQAAGTLNTNFAPIPLRSVYQDACHLVHAQRVNEQPRRLLRAIPQLELVEMEESSLCCGSAGVYNITRPTMAARLGERKASHITATRAQIVITSNPGCYLQLRATLRHLGSETRVIHIADLLDAAYRGRLG